MFAEPKRPLLIYNGTTELSVGNSTRCRKFFDVASIVEKRPSEGVTLGNCEDLGLVESSNRNW